MTSPLDRASKLCAVRQYINEGRRIDRIAEQYCVTRQTVNNWLREYRQTGDIHECKCYEISDTLPLETISISLEPELRDWVRAKAQKEQKNISRYMRELITEMYEKERSCAYENNPYMGNA